MTSKEIVTSETLIALDPGIDDALAFLVAQAANHHSSGYIATFGNGSTSETFQNLATLAQLHQSLTKDTTPLPQILLGTDRPLGNTRPYQTAKHFIHGPGAMEGLGRDLASKPKYSQTYYENLKTAPPKSIDLYSFAPPTELYYLLKNLGPMTQVVNSLTLMGGTLGEQGNKDIYAEANFNEDPLALKNLLTFADRAALPTTIVPLNLTEDSHLQFTPDRAVALIESLVKRGSPEIASLLTSLVGPESTYSRFYTSRKEVFKFINGIPAEFVFAGPPIHDLTALYVQLHPELFEFREYPLAVGEQGEIGVGRSYFKNVVGKFKVAIALAPGAGDRYWELTENYLAGHYN